MSMNLTLLLVGVIIMIAVLAALVFIGVAVYRNRKRQLRQLTPDEAVEVTSTWNMLNH